MVLIKNLAEINALIVAQILESKVARVLAMLAAGAVVTTVAIHLTEEAIRVFKNQGGADVPSPKDTKGPVGKTGPTAGQNRSRNQDGQWRRKRSDAGKSRKR